MKFNHIGIPTNEPFEGEINLPHLKITCSDHQNNPYGIQWMRYWDDAPYPDLVKTVAHVAFEVDDLARGDRRTASHHRAEQPQRRRRSRVHRGERRSSRTAPDRPRKAARPLTEPPLTLRRAPPDTNHTVASLRPRW